MNKMTEEHKRVVHYCIQGMRDETKERFMKERHMTDRKAGQIVKSTANKWFAICKNRCKGISRNELGCYWMHVRKSEKPDQYWMSDVEYYIS